MTNTSCLFKLLQFHSAENNVQEQSYQMKYQFCFFFDNFTGHCSFRYLQIRAENRILVITFRPHSSSIFQFVDLLTNALVKNRKKEEPQHAELHPAANHAYRLIKGYEAATKSTNVRAAFIRGNFDYKTAVSKQSISFNEERIRNSNNFEEVWRIDYSENLLSILRRKVIAHKKFFF